VDGQGVDTAGQFVGKYRVNLLMTFYLALPCEGITHQGYLEVAFRTWWHGVHMAFVDHLQQGGGKGRLQLVFDLGGDTHN